nr:MAG TPA: hypothetical protein [Caudoviricetes sp.]
MDVLHLRYIAYRSCLFRITLIHWVYLSQSLLYIRRLFLAKSVCCCQTS